MRNSPSSLLDTTTVSPIAKDMCFSPTEMDTGASSSVHIFSTSESVEPGTTKLQFSSLELSSFSVRFASL